VNRANHRQSWRKFNDFRLPAVKEMKKAGVMAHLRKDPQFATIEVLTPSKAGGATAHLAILDSDIADADFETVQRSSAKPIASDATRNSLHSSAQGLGLLRRGMPIDTALFASDNQLSPGFLAVTLLLAFAVFWLCGGHALLY
jgi:hypothetical protein